jgi:competence protein ComEC
MTIIKSKGIKKRILSASSDPIWIEGVQVNILSPPAGENFSLPASYSKTNNNSLVMKISFGNISFLFTGDILEERERMLIKSRAPLLATFLKVPHHGREGSSSYDFVRNVLPQVAVISCRSFGREKVPSPRILHEYRQIGTQIYRTDVNGAIMVETDGKKFHIVPYRNSSSSFEN